MTVSLRLLIVLVILASTAGCLNKFLEVIRSPYTPFVAPPTALDIFVGVCQNISSRSIRTQCLTEVAAGMGDAEVCNQIYFAGYQKERRNCVVGVVLSTGDSSLCRVLPPTQNDEGNCLFIHAVSLADAAKCEEIEFPTVKSACIAEVAKKLGDKSLCGRLTASEVEWCLAQVGGDDEYCLKQTDPLLLDECYFTLAYSKRDPSFCPKIQSTASKDLCYLFMIDPSRGASYCEKISEESAREYCLRKTAGGTASASPCERLEDDGLCRRDAAIATGDIEECRKLGDGRLTSSCIEEVAKNAQDPVLCAGLANELLYSRCFTSVAASTKNTSMCQKVASSDSRLLCTVQAANWTSVLAADSEKGSDLLNLIK